MRLRLIADADVPAIRAACQDPEVQRWTRVPVPYRREDAVEYVGVVSPAAWAAGTHAHFAVLDATTAEVLGSTSLMVIEHGSAEIGYWCAPQARGRGVMTDAVGAVCRWGFAALGLERLRLERYRRAP